MNEATASQCDLILEALIAADGDRVSMPELSRISGSLNVHTRIDQLRHERGLNIKNEKEREKGSTRQHSFYRLITADPSDQRDPSDSPAPVSHVDTATTR